VKKTMKKIYLQKRLLESFRKNRERIAIEYGAREIKYSQLEKMCLSVSHWLLRHKTRKGTSIGIYIEDKVDFIAVLLGILNTGGIFIPLDTHLPVKRIEKMLQVTQPGLIICDQQGQKRLLHHLQTNINPGKIICISQVFNEREDLQLSLEDVVEYSSEGPIYVYFTSGTTGTPKAILGKNISLLHFIDWEIQTFAIDETFRVSQLTRLGFDAFLRDLFVPLLVGGTLCIPGNPDILMDSESLIYWLETNRIGLVHCVPSIFRIFNTKALKKENFQHLKYVLLSGESIIPQELKNWYDIMGDRIQLVNLYGPTETTLIKTCYFIKKEDVNRGRIPIGKPMKGARLILFDKNMKICEPGFIGDIYIRTPYRTFGYLNDPQLNFERFIPNPLGGEQTDLLFKTGDQGVELPEGNFEFLGRRDRQVKIRGIRVELDEVERVMIQHPSIDNAVVIDREEKDRDKYLCAYFISRGTVEISELREYLSEELPDYMIPSYFLQLEAFPLTPNGKLDRKALPAPGLRPVENDEAPVGRIQETLVNIWSEVLKIDRKQIGINSDFFELGGHSLKAIMLASGIHQALNVKMALTEIFKTPTIRELSRYIKQEHKHHQTQDRYIAIEPVEEKEYYALSSAQKRLFILHQWDDKGIGYNMPRVVDLEGNLDWDRLEESFKKLIARHESLRTSFEMGKDEPVQKIQQDLSFKIEYFDCTVAQVEVEEKEQKTEDRRQKTENRRDAYLSSVIRHLSSEFIRPFDLSLAPLLRVGLIKIAIDKHILMVDMHHIISDAGSMDIFIRDFIALYSDAVLPGLKISYKDYSRWHNKEKEYIKHQEEFWTREFRGEISVLELPTDNARPGVFSFEGQRVRFQLEDKITNALNQLAREQDATLYMVLLAIYNIWLSKICGQEDIIVGSPIAGRRHADLEEIIGMFVNTMALRNYPAGEKNFTDFLREVRTGTLTALENQDYQFEDLVEKVAINRDLSRNPLFDVMFVLQNTGISKVDIPGLKLKRCELETGISKFDLTFNCEEVEESLFFTVEFRTKLFTISTIQKFIDYFKKIVAGVLDNKDIRIREIEILSEKEQRQLLYDFNDTAARYPKDKTIHQLFESRVERVPENIAIIGPDPGKQHVHLTYNQLNKTSNQLAYVLKEKGVQPDTIVGIMIKRSIDMIIGILGILKAGGAYLPLDPDYPEGRIKFILSDSSAKVLVKTSSLADEGKKVRRIEGKKILLEEVFETPSSSSTLPPFHPSTLRGSSLAYVIYTSGSTGKPKGVLVEQASVVNLAFSQKERFNINNHDRILQFSSICFDASVEQIFIALFSGAVLVLIDKNTLLGISNFEAFIFRHGITHLHAVPSFLSNMSLNRVSTSPLKRVIAGGDICPASLVEKWNSYCDFYNEYGPTETTVTSIEMRFEHVDEALTRVSIGRPIHNTTVYLLDRWLYLVPLGFVGELYIGGDGVARGYLNQPELTAEKFCLRRPGALFEKTAPGPRKNFLSEGTRELAPLVPGKNYMQPRSHASMPSPHHPINPISHSPHSPTYRTGDLARWLPEGDLEFIGRIDHQIKIRGFRVELGEIENCMLSCDRVKEAAVVVKETQTGDKHLCAYLVPDILEKEDAGAGENELSAVLKEYLLSRLPGYMIPQYFVPLETLPLTANGKLDRKSLPEPGIRSTGEYTAPRDELEEKLADIWSGVLGVNKEIIGIDDNFFDLGGHSLSVIILASRIKKELKVAIPLGELFQTPTLRGISSLIEVTRWVKEQGNGTNLQQQGKEILL
jgi:amino acid adenylation domain-containing protein